jgi:hypothetical protein
MRCIVIFRERVATFKFLKMDFLAELQQGNILFIGISTSSIIPVSFKARGAHTQYKLLF